MLRGSVDQADLVRAEPSLEDLLHAFNVEYGPLLLPGEVGAGSGFFLFFLQWLN